jgi:hypothetical protein
MRSGSLLLACWLAATGGCGSSGSEPAGSAGTAQDSGPKPEASIDAQADVPVTLDAKDEAKQDAGNEAAPDGPNDAPDAMGDVAPETQEAEAAAPSCADQVKNGAETDVDCGGGTCPRCDTGAACAVDADCQSEICSGFTCKAPACNDTVMNAAETDIDCGGGTCPACADLLACKQHSDCQSGYCKSGQCKPGSCSDGVKDGSETDLDCGGAQCSPCAALKSCVDASDCVSLVCTQQKCVAAACDDGVKNGSESDIDCSGACPKCVEGKACVAPSDCVSAVCTGDQCQAATCSDGVKNQTETDMDCGGPSCGPCDATKSCLAPQDCLSFVCTAGKCKAAACNDGVKNGTESDVDCGGTGCAACNDAAACLVPADCKSGVCTGAVCQIAACNDGAKNALETDVDCGGTTCPACAAPLACKVASDCQSKVCTASHCQAESCSDNVINGTESDIDCGGTTCPKCVDGKTCNAGSDCVAQSCYTKLCGSRMWTSESAGSNITIPGSQIWVDATSLALSPNLNVPATALLRWTGTLRWAGGGNGLCHVGQRFVIDGVPTGNATWGDAIMVLEGATRWHQMFTVEKAVPLAAGGHYISVQMTNANGYGSCYLDGDSGQPYDRSRFAITAWDPAEAWYAESTGQTGALGSNSAWTDIPGAGVSFTLGGDRHVQLSVQGTQVAQGAGQSHCAYRFVLDGTALGDPNHGQAIAVGDVDQGWWEPVVIKYGTDLTAGDHNVQVQLRNSAASGGTCNAGEGNNGYAKFHLSALASAPGAINRSYESTGGSQVLGSASAWTTVTGLDGSFDLAEPGHVQMEFAGTQRTVSGYGHCVWRFVVDGTGLGNADHGQAINVGEGAETWWTAMSMLWGQSFPAGTHTVSVQVRNSSNSGDCGTNGDGLGYGRTRMLIRGVN